MIKNILVFILLVVAKQAYCAEKSLSQLPWFDAEKSFEHRADLLVNAMTLDEKIAQLSHATPAIPRLNVPEYNWWNEALHGVARNGKATIFPQAIGLAATFDLDLAYRVSSAISDEARAKYKIAQSIGNNGQYAGLSFWTPNINIFRDPRWGRGQETYGEDPLLTARIGTAFVKGLQGNDPKYLKSAGVAKHFAVHSGPESLRHHFDVVPSKKDLLETYLPAFEALVKDAKVAGVMCAYNAVNGAPACANSYLLDDLLKQQWGFNGYIVSDCGALNDFQAGHKVTKSGVESAALALKSGINLNCGDTYTQSLKKSFAQGMVTETLIDERLKQLLLIRFRLGFFDPEKLNPYTNLSPDIIHSDKNIQLSREVAAKSIVLLKNKNNTLPLSKTIKLPYVTGPFAASSDMLIGNYYGITDNLVTVLEGVAGKVSLGSSLNYRSGALPFHKNINPLNWAPHEARAADAVIAVVGVTADMEGEEVDAIASPDRGDRVDITLPQNQIDYVKEIAKNKKGPLILVVAAGSPVALGELHELADAILWIWYPGEQGGNAVADVLFGDANPSGHLPLTFPASINDLPPFENYSMAGRTYKYMTKTPLYPFGFGLSYTKYLFKKLQLDKQKITEDQSLIFNVDVENSGKMAGETVVQAYLSPLSPIEGEAIMELKVFKRVLLEPNQKQRVQFEIDKKDLYRINQEGNKVRLSGRYTLWVGDSLPSKRSLDLGAAVPQHQVIEFH
ncbi:glycoside hydrolase family 3 C-terminal domain-containing protein [Cellvibrio sp. OA-2007]|uniref:glycoside hydrolase family 3 C-terminal domain-containing protein n=1 Tax=Cellvibrio sp. OA-2007 TaxID=529823 RepID=UPI0007865D66|nr:glycoside hydrolase family 3 C-terminal domain-containing protein [Cellvibrio sp. OA-2007]